MSPGRQRRAEEAEDEEEGGRREEKEGGRGFNSYTTTGAAREGDWARVSRSLTN
jgi:hypothetical protein